MSDLHGEGWAGLKHGLVDGAVRRVAVKDFRHARVEGHRLPLRAGGQVGGGQRVRDRAVFEHELIEGVGEPTFTGFESSAAVVSHERGEPQREVAAQEVVGAVYGMHSGLGQFGCVADVVQPSSGDKQVAVREVHGGYELPGPLGDGLHVSPSVRERWHVQVTLGEFRGGADKIVHRFEANRMGEGRPTARVGHLGTS